MKSRGFWLLAIVGIAVLMRREYPAMVRYTRIKRM